MWRLLFLILPLPALAESLVATRTIRAQSILAPADMTLVAAAIPGALTSIEAAIGLEARVAIYAGRPITPDAIGPAAIIDRNQLVTLVFTRGGLTISADGRALGRGGVGDTVQVMNIASRSTMSGQIAPDGSVRVTP
ncbi:MAG: flagellar basal body P-ring formation chaperone FlgA [Pseudomonadota bacterium]